MSTHIFYHGGCYDGLGAAYAAWKALGENAEYTPVYHGRPVPNKVKEGDSLYIVDFAYPRDVLIKLNEKCSKLQVLDHHISAQKDLEGLPFAYFDMDMSGAGLSWEHFHPNKPMPLFIQHLQDRDLWKFDIEGTKEVHALLVGSEMNFEVFDKVSDNISKGGDLRREVYLKGKAMMQFQDSNVKKMCNQAYLGELNGYKVPFVNATCSWSEVGEELIKLFDAPFAVSYFDRSDGYRQFSLRSRGGFDVSKVAKMFGGGGHKAAAGFQIKQENSKVLSSNE